MLFFSLLLPYFLGNFHRPFLAVVAGDLSRDLGLDAAGLASLQAAFLLAFALTQVPVALSLDRFGPRRMVMLSLCSAALGDVLFSMASQPWQAMLAMVLLGAGFSPVMMVGFYVIGRVYAPARFATLTSLLFGIGTLGDPLSGAPLAFAVGQFGWRPTMFVMACLTALSLLLIAVTLRDPPRVEAPGGKISAWEATKQIFAIRSLWLMVPYTMVGYAVVASVRGLWIAPYLSGVHHFDPHDVGLGATAMGLALAIGGILYGQVNRLLREAKLTVTIGGSVTVVAWLALGLFGYGSAFAALTLLLLAAAFGSNSTIILAHSRPFLPTHLLGQGVTMMNMWCFCGASLGQWLSGRYVKAAEVAGVAPEMIYGRLYVGFSVLLAISIAVYFLVPRERSVFRR